MQQSKDHSERRPRTALIHSARFLGALAWVIALLLGSGPGYWANWAVPSAQAAQPDEQVAIPVGNVTPIRGNSPAAPDLTVVKSVVAPAGRTTFYTGETVQFQVVVENTGDTTISYLPQLDEYGPECLEFIPKASPAESSSFAGLIEWYDLTFVTGVDLAPGEQFVTTMNYLVTGPTTGNSATSYNTATVRGALDAGGAPVPEAQSTVDFTCAARPSVAVDKAFVTPQNRTVLLTGETVSFNVLVTNTGATTLGYIPLLDTYDASCLEFIPKASPAESTSGTGVIEWYDLTFVNGQDLPPGQVFTTTMSFLVTGPTAGATEPGANTALVSGALDIFGSPTLDRQDSVQYTCAAPASIGDYVWHDANGDGLQNEGPGAGLNGVTVRLYQDDGDGIFEPGGDDVLLDTQVTAGDGAYLFDMLHAGNYWVDVDQTTVPPTMSLTAGTDPRPVTVAYGEAYLIADYGYRGAGVSISKVDSADPILVGDTLTYTLSVSNSGPSDALAVVVTDTLPAGVAFVSATPGQTSGPNPLVWNLGTIPAGNSRTITVVTTVSPNTSGTIVNRAKAHSSTPDPNPGDNEASEPTLVITPAIAIDKMANPTVTLPGGQVGYTYLVTNPGDVSLVDVTVTDDRCSPVTGPEPAGDVNGNGLLDPGEVWSYLCTAAVADDTTNTATAVGQPADPQGQPFPGVGPVDDQDTAFVDVVNPAIHIVKTPAPTTVYPGEQVVYTYAVTNPGDVPLAGVTVSDDKCSPVVYVSGDADGDGLLDLAETWLFHCTAIITEDTLNTATTAGQPTDDQGQPLLGIGPVRDLDTALVDVIRPALQIVKTPDALQVLPGTLVTYSYAATNIGDAPLTNVAVADDKCAPVSGPAAGGDANNNGRLDPGETWLYQCSRVLDEDTVNVATATASDPLGGPVTDDAVAFVDVLQPGLQVDKVADATVVYAGTEVLYTYTVRNTSADSVYNVGVADDRCAPLVFQGGDANGNNVLEQGEVWTYTCAATLTEDTPNTVTATGIDALGNRISDQDFESVDVINPAINVVKSAHPTVTLPGGAVRYTYLVTNPGDDPLGNVIVSDDKCSSVQYESGDANGDGKLDLDEAWLYACVANVSEDTTNTVTAVGDDSLGNPVRDTDTAFVDVVRPAIAVVKTVNPPVALSGSLVLYSYQVTNPGDVPLGNVTLADDTCAPVQYQTGDANSNSLLEPGETWTFTCATVVAVDTVNTVTATGQPADPNGQPLPGIPSVSDQDTAQVNVVDPAIHIVKTAAPTTVYAGDSVTYAYVVTNPGDVPLAGVTVSDDKCSPVTPMASGGFNVGDTNQNGLLDPGEAWRYACTTTITEDTLNTATTVGQPTDPTGQPLPGIGPVRAQDSAEVDVIWPAIQVVKTPSATQVPPGTPVTYSYAVSNSGDVPLTSVVVSDDKCAPVTPIPASGQNVGDVNSNGKLDPGETWVYQCTATLMADTVNLAAVTAVDPLGGPVTDNDQAFVDVLLPGLQIEKAAAPAVGYLGQALLYTYHVTNTGADPAYNVDVTDDKCSPVTPATSGGFNIGDTNTNGALDPGEIWSYQCATAFTGDITNIATVTGEDALGNPTPSDQAAATVNTITPAINVVKIAAPTVILPGGAVLYTYIVTNPGDDPLANVTVTDDKCSPVVYQSGDAHGVGLLDPGEVWIYTCVANPIEDTTNTVIATGDDSLGNPVRDTDTAFVDVVRPAINVVKSVHPTVTLPGGLVLYTYVVTNPGDVPLVGVSLTDNTCAPVFYQDGDLNTDGLLDLNETWRYTCTTSVSADTTNTVTAVGQPAAPDGIPLPGIGPVTAQDTAFVDVITPRIVVEKTANPAVIHAGDSVTYSYVVTNPGDAPLANVSVTDNKCSPVAYGGGDANGNSRLDPGEAWLYSCTTTLNADTLNTVTATGQPTDPSGQPLPGIVPVSGTAAAFVDVLNPGIRIVKSGPTASFVGDTALFTYAVTNTGDAPLAHVAVSDDVCGAATYQSGDADGNALLGLSEIWVFECSYTITSTDPDPLVNTATGTGVDALERSVGDLDQWSTDLFTVRLGDFVWEDDGDGVQEPGETTGLANVPIHITGVDVLGNTIDITVLTSATGFYGVDNLLPGVYTVTAPMVFGAFVRSSPGSFTVTLSSELREDLTLDFGYVRPTGVQLVDFNLARTEAAIRLTWEIALPEALAEAPLFHVYRAVPDGAWKRLTPTLLAPTSQDDLRALYDFIDSLAEPGQRYLYQLRSATGETFGPWQTDLPAARRHFYLPFVRR